MEQKENENDTVESSDRSQVVAGVLAFFLGGIGAHRFYIGKPGTAILMMLGTGVGIVLLIIGLVGVMAGVGQAMEGDAAAADETAATVGGIAVFAWIVLGAIGLWTLIDFIRIVSGKMRDKKGLMITSISGK